MGRGVQNGGKIHEFNFCFEIDLHSYFHATCALLEDFEIFDNFDHILSLFRPLKVIMTRLGPKIELSIWYFDQVYTAKQKTMRLTTPLDSI